MFVTCCTSRIQNCRILVDTTMTSTISNQTKLLLYRVLMNIQTATFAISTGNPTSRILAYLTLLCRRVIGKTTRSTCGPKQATRAVKT